MAFFNCFNGNLLESFSISGKIYHSKRARTNVFIEMIVIFNVANFSTYKHTLIYFDIWLDPRLRHIAWHRVPLLFLTILAFS
jgi:hypothetical protein